MFHLEVNVNGQIRYILMFPTTIRSHVIHMYAPLRSTLWLLYEGMIIPPGRQQFALLGATYLPNEAHGYLQDQGVLRVAFAEHMNVLH